MPNDPLLTAFQVPEPLTAQTKQMSSSLSALVASGITLNTTVDQINGATLNADLILSSIAHDYIFPLQTAYTATSEQMKAVLQAIVSYCETMAGYTAPSQWGDSVPEAAIEDLIRTMRTKLAAEASSLQDACTKSESSLVAYKNQMSAAAAQIDTMKSSVSADLASSRTQLTQVQSDYDQMSRDGNALGMQADQSQIDSLNLDIQTGNSVLSTLGYLDTDLTGVVNVAGELGITWKALGDQLGDLQIDLSTIDRAELAQDMAYLTSDWNALLTLAQTT